MKKLSLLIFLGVLIFLITEGCEKRVFDGSITANDEQFIMSYSVLNSIKTHDIKLDKGTTVNVTVERISGKLDILISDSNGEKIYKSDNAASGKFSVEAPETDTYRFSVKGKNAKGSVSFKVAK